MKNLRALFMRRFSRGGLSALPCAACLLRPLRCRNAEKRPFINCRLPNCRESLVHRILVHFMKGKPEKVGQKSLK